MFSNRDLEEEEIKILCQLIENQNESFLTDFQTISFLLKVQEQQILDYIKSHKIQPALVKQFENELKLEYQAKGIILENKSFDQKVDDKQKRGLDQKPQEEQFQNDQQGNQIINSQDNSSQQKQIQCKICKNYLKNYLTFVAHQEKVHKIIQTSKDIKKRMNITFRIKK